MARDYAAKNYNIDMYEEHITENFESPRAFRHAMRTKAAPKLGRTIGAAAKAGKRVVPYDPNARNADKDKTVQDGTIWERPAVPDLPNAMGKLTESSAAKRREKKASGLSSGSKSSLFDRLVDREIDGGEEIPEKWFEAAETIDAAVVEQIEIAIGVKNPNDAVFSKELSDEYKVPAGKKKPSLQYILKNALDNFNNDTGSDVGLPEIIARIMEETPQYTLFDSKIKGYFFASDATREAHAIQLHKRKKYKYGDRSALDGSEIRPTSTDWLKGLSPKQIAEIIVPESLDEAFEIHLDLSIGKSEADRLRNNTGQYLIARASYKQTVTTIYESNKKTINFTEASPDEMKKVRDFVEKTLAENPMYLSAVHKFGTPPILAVKPVNEDEVTPEKLIGWYSPSGYSIMFPTTSFEHLETSDEILNDARNIGNAENSIESQYGIFKSSTSARAVTHEWAHYLQDLALGRIGQKNNGTRFQSGIKYDSGLDDVGNLAKLLTDQVSRDSVKVTLSQDEAEMTAKIMQQAKDYNSDLREVMSEVEELVLKLTFGIGEIDKDIDPVSEMNDLEKEISEIIDTYDSLGIISAPSFYSTKSESEQFAEMIAFFMSGPEHRSLLTPTTIKELEAIFSSVIAKSKIQK